MSMLWTWKKLFQRPVEIERERRDKVALLLAEADDGDADPPVVRCRVCGREDTTGKYCYTCLADTMQPIK